MAYKNIIEVAMKTTTTLMVVRRMMILYDHYIYFLFIGQI